MGNGIFQNHSGKWMGNGQSENGRTLDLVILEWPLSETSLTRRLPDGAYFQKYEIPNTEKPTKN